MHTRYLPGGAGGDGGHPRGGLSSRRRAARFTKIMPARADQYGAILNANQNRAGAPARQPARWTAETLLGLGVNRPAAARGRQPRGTCAKATPYSSYEELRFQDFRSAPSAITTIAFAVRVAEILRVCEDHRPGARWSPGGSVHNDRPQGGPSPRATRLATLDGGP